MIALAGMWLLAAGCGGPDLGTEFRMNPTVRVEPGERFSLSVPSNASAGDDPLSPRKLTVVVVVF